MQLSITQLIRYASILFLVIGHIQAVVPLLAPISLAVFFVCHLPQLRFHREPPAPVVLGATLIAYTLLLLLLHGVLRDYSVFYVLRSSGRLLYMMVVFLVACHIRADVHVERALFYCMLICTAVICCLSIYSRYVSLLVIGGFPLSSQRALTGFFENHNTMAGLIGVVLLLAGVSWVHQQRFLVPRLINWFTLSITVFLAISFALSLSRAYSIGIIVAATFLASRIPSRGMRQIAFSAGAAVACGLVIFVLVHRSDQKDFENVNDRKLLYRRAVTEIASSPLIGIGPGAFQELHRTNHTLIPGLLSLRSSGREAVDRNVHDIYGGGGAHVHNTYLQLMCDIGLVGVLLLAALFWSAWRAYAGVARWAEFIDPVDEPMQQWASWNGAVVFGTLIFLATSGAFVNWCLSSPPYTLCLYICLGRLVAQSETLARRAQLASGVF